MSFKRLFSTALSETASTQSYTSNFGDPSIDLPGVQDLSESLRTEAPQIVKYIRYKLGEPTLSVHQTNSNIFLSFEESNLKYSAIVNTYQARSWMINYYGLNTNMNTADLTGKLPAPYSNFIKRITENIAWEMNPPVGGNTLKEIKKSYIQLVPSQQDYDVYNDIIDSKLGLPLSATVSGTTVNLKTIYHYPASTLYRFYDPYSSINLLSQEFNFESFNTESIFYVLPIWSDILRAQQLNMNDKVRRSNFSYERVGRRLRVFPTPKISLKLFIDYVNDTQDPFDLSNPSTTGISNFYQIPFVDIAYDKINSVGRNWIRNFTYALCMEIEGRIRRKFDKIPIPGDSITMDGQALVQEGIQKQQELEKSLREDLEKLTVQSVMEDNAKLAENTMVANKMTPSYIYLF